MEQLLETGWIKQEYQDVPEYDMYIGATKIEDGVIGKIKSELTEEQMDLRYQKITCFAKESPSTFSTGVKSNNRRTKVREMHQRLSKLDMAVKSCNGAISSRSLQNACQTTNGKSHSPQGSLSPAEHMRDLRQRLMKLEKCNNFTDIRPRKISNQHRREMREQRQLTYDSQDTNDNNTKNGNYRPQTPPQVVIKRMREFRQRLLKLKPIDVHLTYVKSRNTTHTQLQTRPKELQGLQSEAKS